MLINLQWDVAPKDFERLSDAVPGNAAANKLLDESHHRLTVE
jgi:hypothetical protein